ncbi:MAG: carbohydrate-binding protein [Chitinophagaceae bacterium]
MGVLAGTINIPSTGEWNIWQTITLENVQLQAGSHVLRIQSNNNENCNFNWMNYELADGNQPPVVNAGSPQSIITPVSQVTLSGSATDADGIASHTWTLQGKPAGAVDPSITTPSQYATTVTGLTHLGVYTFRLTAQDNIGASAFSDVTITVNQAGPPTVEAGPTQTIVLPTNQVTLSGSASANNGGSITFHEWTRIGAGYRTITTPGNYTTTVTGLSAGVHTFRLTVRDNDNNESTDDVIITVNPASGTTKYIPGKIEAESYDAHQGGMYATSTSDAGGGQQVIGITNGSWMDYNVVVTQSGIYKVGFRVATPQLHTQFLIKMDGVLAGTINIPSTGEWNIWQTITLENVQLQAGSHVLRIQSNNNENCNFNWMNYELADGNQPPVVNAGSPQSIITPVSQVTLSGSATDADGIASHTWTLQGKPAGAVDPSITTPSQYATTVTGLTHLGVYTFRLTAQDNIGASAFSDVTITVNQAGPPTVEAGPTQTIVLPTNQVTLSGSASANNGGSITFHEWTRIGAGTGTITTPGNYTTTVTGLSAGVHTFRLTVRDNDNNESTDDVIITVNPASGTTKYIPGKIEAESYDAHQGGMYTTSTSDAGGGQQVVGITNGSSMDYNVMVTQSGIYKVGFRVATPQPNAQFQIKLGSDVLGTVTIPNTGEWNIWQTVTLESVHLTAGAQTLRIQSVTNQTCNFNWMNYELADGNQPPVVNAGSPQSIITPVSQVTLSGSATDADGIASHTWTLQGKPAGAVDPSITTPSQYATTVTGLTHLGVYTFRLTAQDNIGASAFSDVTITVNQAGPPTVEAGPTQTIVLPTNQVTLSGSASANNGGSITFHEWTRIGAGTGTITTPGNYTTTVTGLSAGVHTFRLTVRDNDNNESTDDVIITVNPASGTTKYIPGKIEAESYDAHQGGMYATSTSDVGGGQQVVGINNGGTMDYNVMVSQTGTYTVGFRVATPQLHTQFQIKMDGGLVGTINIPNTGEWNIWQTITLTNVQLVAGAHTMRIQSTNNENCNFNWMNFELASAARGVTEIPLITESKALEQATKLSVSVFPNPTETFFNLKVQSKTKDLVQIRVFDMTGHQVQFLQGTPDEIMRVGFNLAIGIYIIETRQGTERIMTKVVKQ